MAFIQNRKPIPAVTSYIEIDPTSLSEVYQNVDNFSETITFTHHYYVLQYDVEYGVPELDGDGNPVLDGDGNPVTNDIETDNSHWEEEPATITQVVWVNKKPKIKTPFPNYIGVSWSLGAVVFSGYYYLWFDLGRNFNWVYSLSTTALRSVELYEEIYSPVVAAVDMNADLRERDTVIYRVTTRRFDRVAGTNRIENHTINQVVKNHWDLDRDQTRDFAKMKDIPTEEATVEPTPEPESGGGGSSGGSIGGTSPEFSFGNSGPVSQARLTRSPMFPLPGSTYTIDITNAPPGPYSWSGGSGTTDGSVSVSVTAPDAVPLQKQEQEIVFNWRDGTSNTSLVVIEDPVIIKMGTDSLIRTRYREFIKYYLNGADVPFFVSTPESDAAWLRFYYERYY